MQNADSLTEAFSTLSSNTQLRTRFESTFGVNLSDLLDATPKIKTLSVDTTFSEGVAKNLSVTSVHWSAGYTQAYLWRLGSTELSTSSQFVFTPNANMQGNQVLQLFIGKNNGSGSIDFSKPYIQQSFDITINNSIPALAPILTRLSPEYTNSTSVSLQIATGAMIDGRPASCHSFSGLVIIEDDYPALAFAPTVSSSYTIDCTQASTQNISFTLSGTQGLRTLRLWAIDSSGNVSASSRDITLIYDTVAPALSFTSLNSGNALRGGTTQALQWNTTELYPTTNTLSIEWSPDNGTSWSTLATNVANSGSYSWSVPSINTSQGLFRLTVVDSAGNSGSVTSSQNIIVDSAAPAAPNISLTSASLSNSLTAIVNTTCDADYAFVLYKDNSTAPAIGDSSWQTCTSSNSVTVSSGDGTKTIYAWAKDAVGNITASPSSHSYTLDQTAPTIALTTILPSHNRGGASLSFQFSVTENHITTSQSFTVSYSSDNGSTWTTAGDVTSTNGPLSSQNFTYPLVFPSLDTNNFRLRVTAQDTLGNTVISSATTAVTIDSTPPTISSFSLAGGSTAVALPYVVSSLVATDALTTVSDMQFSESTSPDTMGWVSYSTTGNFTLSQVNGPKTVRAWARDSVGNVSSPVIYSITLDFGSPPTLTVTSPSAGETYLAGDSVPISWNCSSSNGLDASAPISVIQYTLDDGANFCPITTNIISANGTYSWTFPSTNCNSVSTASKAVRVMVSCKSAAGVVSNAYSQIFNTSGWTVFAGDPWYATQEINATTAIVTPSATASSSVTGDPSGHIYYVYNNAIMKINASTGVVTRYAGSLSSSGCTLGSGASLLAGTVNAPVILGMNTDQTSILVLLQNCGKIISIDTVTNTAVDWLTVNAPVWTFTKEKWLVYYDTYDNNTAKIWKVDLKTSNGLKTWIAGTGTACGPIGSVGSDAKLSTLKCGSIASNTPLLIANSDASRVWFSTYSGGTATRIDFDIISQNYLIHSNTSWTSNDMQQCRASPFDSYIYCRNWYNGRNINVFNPTTGLWETDGILPFVNNEDTGFISIGFTPSKMLVYYTLNALNVVTPVIGGSWTYLNIAGQPLTTMGNGGPLSGVAFSQPVDVKYNSNTQSLWVRNSSGHLRCLDAANSYTTSTVVLANGTTDMDANQPPMFINLTGNKIALPGSWMNWTRLSNFSLSSTTTTYLTQFMSRGAASSNTYPPTNGTNVLQDVGNIRGMYFNIAHQNMVYHSNGKLYLAAKNGTSDVFIFASNNSTIERIAGKLGVGGYSALDHGASALGASLTGVQHLMEISAGTYAGDLLVVDKDWLRRISVSTESSSPKIYDVFNLNNVAGYTSGTTFSDFHYDSASETAGLGTGNIYFATIGNTVHKIVPLSDLSGGTFSTYSITGTTLTGTVRLTLAPAGLLVLQANKNRILRLAP